MTLNSRNAILLTLLAAGIWPAAPKATASKKSNRPSLFVVSGQMTMWKRDEIDLGKDSSLTKYMVNKTMRQVGQIQPGQTVNLVYAHTSKGDIAVLVQLRPAIMVMPIVDAVIRTPQPRAVAKEEESAIWKLVGSLDPATSDTETAVAQNAKAAKAGSRREPNADVEGSLVDVQQDSPENATLRVRIPGRADLVELYSNLFTDFDQGVSAKQNVRITYKEVQGKKIASQVRVEQVPSELLRKNLEPATGGVSLKTTPIPGFQTPRESAQPASEEAQANAQTIEQQLNTIFQVAHIEETWGTPTLSAQGTALRVEKGGILGVPYSDVTTIPTRYEDGQMHAANSIATTGIGGLFNKYKLGNSNAGMAAGGAKLLQIGDTAYPSKIKVDPVKDRVTLGIVTPEVGRESHLTKYYKSDVIFQFPKGYLADASPSQVENTIAQVFTIDTESHGENGASGTGSAAQSPGTASAAESPAAASSQNATPKIKAGQTMAEVEQALGKPDKVINLGAKSIYVYKDLKVTFFAGRVTDIQ